MQEYEATRPTVRECGHSYCIPSARKFSRNVRNGEANIGAGVVNKSVI
jgi:hypothetical protein